VPYQIKTIGDAVTAFGPASSLTLLCSAVINRGSSPVIAAASKKGTAPLLTDRQTVWDNMAGDRNIRIRLTDSTAQADHAALADSCEAAEQVQNKQFCIVGLATATPKATYITAAGAIASKRGVLVGPGVYDEQGVLQAGPFTAACVAAEVSKNSDPSNDLDLWTIPFLTGIEKDASGFPIFREKIVSGVATNDYEDLLQGGVSPLQPSFTPGGVMTTHLRMAWVTDSTYDALSTRLIVDQVFVDVKNYIYAGGYLRRGNTETTRNLIASGVESLLLLRQDWVQAVVQPDGTLGYNVSATASPDMRQIIVSFTGVVVRGVQTILVSAQLIISV
jgi:hypothetical protein